MREPAWVTNGLVAFYPFNGNANDESGHRRHGRTIAASLAVDRFGNPDHCYYVFGGSSVIQLHSSIPLGQPNSPASFCLWLRATNGVAGTVLCDHDETAPTLERTVLFNSYLTGSGTFGFEMSHAGSRHELVSSRRVTDNHWHMVVVTLDGRGSKTIYVDGKLDTVDVGRIV